jgi:hypothetical protein
MSKVAASLMVAVVAFGAVLLGASFGYEGGFGLVVGGVGFWVSPGMALIGGLAAFGAFVIGWIVLDELNITR